MLALLFWTLQDTPVTCLSDQLLGVWEVSRTSFDVSPKSDKLECPKNISVHSTKRITLRTPNIALDEDGFTGTWTIVYT